MLSRARCLGCSQPLGDPPFVSIPVNCASCASANWVEYGADGQAASFDSQQTPQDLLRWFAGARVALGSGNLGIAVGRCSSCKSPLCISKATPVLLPCPHCQLPVQGFADLVLTDLWPEPWTRIEKNEANSLEFRLALLEDEVGEIAGCGHCGAPTPPQDPSPTCSHCGAVCWVSRTDPEGGKMSRFQLGVRVTGTVNKLPYRALYPISVGESVLGNSARANVTTASGSGRVAIIGFAVFVGLAVLIGIVTALFARL